MNYPGEPEGTDGMAEILASGEAGFFRAQAFSVSGWLSIHG